MIHTVVIKSVNGTKVATGQTGSINYTMNWGFLNDNTKYKIRSYFNSKSGNYDGNSLGLVYADFLTASNTYEAQGNNGGYYNSNFLTMIHPETVSSGGNDDVHLQSHSVDSAWISLNNKPLNSIFNVTIKNVDNTNFTMGDVEYTLILEFHEI
jgi:hypothetical protein